MDFKEVIKKRRAVNFFDPQRPVPDELLNRMIEAAALAPSGFNLQPWSLIVVTGEESKRRLQKLAMNQPKVSQAPVVLIVLADTEGWKSGNPSAEKVFSEMVKAGAMDESQREWFFGVTSRLYGSSTEKSVAFACKNAALFAMSLMLAAKDLGLDTHPMDGFDMEGVKSEFGIPSNFWVPLLIAVGYFDEGKALPPPKSRKSIEEIVINRV